MQLDLHVHAAFSAQTTIYALSLVMKESCNTPQGVYRRAGVDDGRRQGERDLSFAEALQRVKGEYLEMPGLQLTPAQAARLWRFEPALCDAVLSALVDMHFLVKTRKALFARA